MSFVQWTLLIMFHWITVLWCKVGTWLIEELAGWCFGEIHFSLWVQGLGRKRKCPPPPNWQVGAGMWSLFVAEKRWGGIDCVLLIYGWPSKEAKMFEILLDTQGLSCVFVWYLFGIFCTHNHKVHTWTIFKPLNHRNQQNYPETFQTLCCDQLLQQKPLIFFRHFFLLLFHWINHLFGLSSGEQRRPTCLWKKLSNKIVGSRKDKAPETYSQWNKMNLICFFFELWEIYIQIAFKPWMLRIQHIHGLHVLEEGCRLLKMCSSLELIRLKKNGERIKMISNALCQRMASFHALPCNKSTLIYHVHVFLFALSGEAVFRNKKPTSIHLSHCTAAALFIGGAASESNATQFAKASFGDCEMRIFSSFSK